MIKYFKSKHWIYKVDFDLLRYSCFNRFELWRNENVIIPIDFRNELSWISHGFEESSEFEWNSYLEL